MHTVICGRGRKNIRLIESNTGTAIYFPPPFPRIFGYTPPVAQRRPDDLIYITGPDQTSILRAKQKLHDLVLSTKIFVKPVAITDTKLDNIILERLDKVRKIIENNGSYILLPPLGQQRGVVRIQGVDVLNVERTIRELMALVSTPCFLIWLEHVLTVRRSDNFTALLGSSPILTPPNAPLRRPKFGKCCRIFASTLERK